MSLSFNLKRGDTSPAITGTLTYSDGSAVNLTGASVRFVMRSQAGSSPKVSAAATIVSPTAGTVSYSWNTAGQDTNVAGEYDCEWIVTFSGGAVQTFPTNGYVTLSIEEDLTTPGGARLVSLEEIRDHLRMSPTDTTFDSRLLRLLDGITPVIENVTGPILQRVYQDESYDGGNWFISLRHRPIVSVASVVEYRGPVPYVLQQVPSPDLGTIYCYTVEPAGRIVRRTVGGGITPFPPGANQVVITYTAGQATVPGNVKEAALHEIALHFDRTELGGGRAFGSSFGKDMGDEIATGPPVGFLLSGKAREFLMASRRHPSVA